MDSRVASRARRIAAGLGAVALTGLVHAATTAYPAKVVRVIVPFPAGAGSDSVTRIVMRR